jgi:hypothetical protein
MNAIRQRERGAAGEGGGQGDDERPTVAEGDGVAWAAACLLFDRRTSGSTERPPVEDVGDGVVSSDRRIIEANAGSGSGTEHHRASREGVDAAGLKTAVPL